MKKLITILLLATYIFSTIGINIGSHYCMNRLIGKSIGCIDDVNCSNCGMKKDDQSGCKGEYKFFRVKARHKIPCQPFIITFNTTLLSRDSYIYQSALYKGIIKSAKTFLPPDDKPVALYKFHCSFLI